jgi:hypothetical protein
MALSVAIRALGDFPILPRNSDDRSAKRSSARRRRSAHWSSLP